MTEAPSDTPARKGRGFSTKYEDHTGLLYKFALMFHGRLQGAGITAMEFEDVRSELNVTYVKALKKYDPEKGITFTAYLGRACINDFNKVAERLELEQFGRINAWAARKSRPAATNEPERCKPIDLEDKTRHYGLGLISTQSLIEDNVQKSSSLESFDDEALTSEAAFDLKRKVKEFCHDETLSAPTRLYVMSIMTPEVMMKPKIKAVIEGNRESIAKELRTRYGVDLNSNHLR
jgi:hypothetical protein